jgi:E3 ubiquitin-protein ligase MARCH5
LILGPLVYTLDLIERILNRFCPFLAGGILVGSVYWTAVTYGAVTIMQVEKERERDFPMKQIIILIV